MTTVAVLGTGTMGAGMARSMRRAGLDVRVWNRTKARAQPLADDGIAVADSAAGAVRGADVVLTMLFDADATAAVIDETGDAWGDAVWIQSATVGPDGIARLGQTAAARGIRIVDAPMLGTKQPAENGKLVALASGDPSLREAVTPVLDAVATKTIWVGDSLGQGSALKLVCNSWIATITAGVAQAVSLAHGLDLDPQLFLDAIDGGASDTPYAHVKGAAMMKQDWTPSFELDGVRKDLGLIRAAAEGAGVATTVFDAMVAVYAAASEAGHGDDDMAAVVTAFGPAPS